MKTCLRSANDECGSLTLITGIHVCSGRTNGKRVMLASITQWLGHLSSMAFPSCAYEMRISMATKASSNRSVIQTIAGQTARA